MKIDLVVDAGVRTFVDLTTTGDPLEPYEATLEEVAAARRLPLARSAFPIPDFGVVDDDDYDVATATIERVLEHGAVFVHCWGGIGRTGTVIGCVLIDEGMTCDEAIAQLAVLRRGSRKEHRAAPEAGVQHDLLRRRASRTR